LTELVLSRYKLHQFWGLANNYNNRTNNNDKKLQGLSGFGRFFCPFLHRFSSLPLGLASYFNASSNAAQEPVVIKFRLLRKIPFIGEAAEALLLTVLIVSSLMFVVYQLAVSKVELEVPELKDQAVFLGRELATISRQYKEAQARLTVLERETDVVRKANRLLREEESQRQAELNLLQAELDFYRRLAGTGGEQTGLAVYEAELSATDSPRVFQYVLTLTQNIRRASIVSGKLKLDVEGTLDDRLVTLFWSQLSGGATAEPSFRFKYFQQFEGYLTLPESFSPTRLLVTLDVKDQRKPVSRTFDWKKLLDSPPKRGATDS
jgi:hypothetical protein